MVIKFFGPKRKNAVGICVEQETIQLLRYA